jgi:MFS transporter, DHA1 family, multidrug resistance protein
MSDLLRETLAGQLIRCFTGDRIIKYTEEKEGFHCPTSYTGCHVPEAASLRGPDSPGIDEKSEEVPGRESETASQRRPGTPSTVSDSFFSSDAEAKRTASRTPEDLARITSRINLECITTRQDLERAYTDATVRSQLRKAPSQPIIPEKTADGIILVDWYDTNDQDNPQNWSFGKKCVVASQI